MGMIRGLGDQNHRQTDRHVMPLGYESDDEPIPTEMLEDICDGSKSHLSVNRREARYRIRDLIKRRQM